MPEVAARVFSEEELDRLATPLSIHLERVALDRDTGGLDWIVAEMNKETLAIYDSYVHWIAVLQTFIVDRAGEAAHDRALNWVAEYAARPFVLRYEELGARARAELLAQRLRASGSTFWVEEDERRIRFRLEPWGPERWMATAPSSEAMSWENPSEGGDGRLRYPTYDYYGDGPISFATLTGARPLTQGRESLPCHLALEVQFLELMPIELFGFPIAAIESDFDAGTAYLDVYKDPADVPAAVYERVGTVKPGRFDASAPEPPMSEQERELLGTPLSVQVEKAAAAGDFDELLMISAGMDSELVGAKDPLGVAIAGLLSWIARHLGEDAAEQALERTAEVVMAPYVAVVRDLEIKDSVPTWAVAWRAHGSTFWIEEREETIIFRGRPLGACHRMYSHVYQPEVERISESRVRYPTYGSYDAPASFHLMREPRGITHGKLHYPIYSCHCHMLHEIYPIEQLGHPLWVEQHNLEDPDGEMIHIHYKDASAWPEHYYELVGHKKGAPVGV
jgi:hypothetical protein